MDLNKIKDIFSIRMYKEGLVTTLIGLAILIFTAVITYQGKDDPLIIIPWLGISLLFLRSKDSLIGLPKDDNWKKNLPNNMYNGYNDEDHYGN